MGQIKTYAQDDPDSFFIDNSRRAALKFFALFGLLFALSITTNNIITLWFWILVATHISGLIYGSYYHIKKALPNKIKYDTSSITQDDINRFMINDPLLSEVRDNRKKLAEKYLRSFTKMPHLWKKKSTNSHFKYNDTTIFFGHKEIEFYGDNFKGKLKIKEDTDIFPDLYILAIKIHNNKEEYKSEF